jgi:hypothetical protein
MSGGSISPDSPNDFNHPADRRPPVKSQKSAAQLKVNRESFGRKCWCSCISGGGRKQKEIHLNEFGVWSQDLSSRLSVRAEKPGKRDDTIPVSPATSCISFSADSPERKWDERM